MNPNSYLDLDVLYSVEAHDEFAHLMNDEGITSFEEQERLTITFKNSYYPHILNEYPQYPLTIYKRHKANLNRCLTIKQFKHVVNLFQITLGNEEAFNEMIKAYLISEGIKHD